MSDVAIHVERLSKRYRIGTGRSRRDSFRDILSQGVRSMFGRGERSSTADFWALQNASFEVRRGENVGIIGLNGAGKSTLLKLLSRITDPTTGRARLSGRVGALLEVGTGFHGELTGRENVSLYGAILGMRQRDIARKFDAIVEFSGVEKFIDTPVKRYSSGMYVRLAFSVAAHLDPEILFLDEVLAVGDLSFQRKCMQFTKELQEKDATILFVSHNMFSIKTMCRRVIYLRGGEIQFDGPTEEGIERYEDDSRLTTGWGTELPQDQWGIVITDCELVGGAGEPKKLFEYGEPMTIRLAYETRAPIAHPNVIVAFVRSDGVAACNYSSEADGVDLGMLDGRGVIELRTPPLSLVAEVYSILVLVREQGFGRVVCSQRGGTFHVRHELFDPHFGVFHESAQWSARAQGAAPPPASRALPHAVRAPRA
jgi:lipopolysaccharide transport system ATP-binding protein